MLSKKLKIPIAFKKVKHENCISKQYNIIPKIDS
jgi:hypothetical protein